jgi:beta-1,4-mannosyl-glycoprotein beta-1,4-N-acetylglucosaminyltransferase
MPKIYDVFPFFNELNLLKIRFETLWDEVDYFVLCEANSSFSGNPKALIFKDHEEDFLAYSEKIIHLACLEDSPDFSPFEREWFQRDYFKSDLEAILKSDDFFLYSDVDEIPKPKALEAAVEEVSKGFKFAHLAQDLFYYFLNLQEISGTLLSSTGEYPEIRKSDRKWLGSVIMRWETARNIALKDIRSANLKSEGVRISDGGWHFSFIGSETKSDPVVRAATKIEGYAHQEFNNSKIRKKMVRRISKGRDIFGRRTSKFKRLSNTDHLPAFIQSNYDDYEDLFIK